jgi:predicted nucleic acid-binding protein
VKLASYIDTSFLLAIAQGEASIRDHLSLWENDHQRFSSRLLWAECIVSLRRSNAHPVQREVAQRLLNGVTAVELGATTIDRLDHEPRLAHCRTLDALHIATALELADHTDGLVIVSLDRRMREVASMFSLRILPEDVQNP